MQKTNFISKLKDIVWKPISIISIFENIYPGKISNASIFNKTFTGGIEYIAATNRNNGCLYFLESTKELENKIQTGNCIGFIKDGDGSAGYAIYKKEDFVSTVNVLYGYANWLNEFTGLFFVTTQDKIKSKYSHGYKRNREHLAGDKVMLPVTDSGKPDYEYMAEYTRQKRDIMLAKYRTYVEARIAELGEVAEIPALDEKDWVHFKMPHIFRMIQRGKRLKNADHVSGAIPFVSSTANNNGVDDYIEATSGTRVFGDCISLANSGSVGTAFYEPFNFVASDHVTALKTEGLSKYSYLFMTAVIEKQGSNFNFNREINDARIKNMQIMLPVTDTGEPDYEYMEQYAKNMVLKKCKQYLAFLDYKKDSED